MSIVTLVLGLYFLIGVVYALYVLFTGRNGLLSLPINIIGGPIALIILIKKVINRERI